MISGLHGAGAFEQARDRPHLLGDVVARPPEIDDVAAGPRRGRRFEQHRLEAELAQPPGQRGPGYAAADDRHPHRPRVAALAGKSLAGLSSLSGKRPAGRRQARPAMTKGARDFSAPPRIECEACPGSNPRLRSKRCWGDTPFQAGMTHP